MTDFKTIAAALDPPVPDAQRFLPVLEALETTFTRLPPSIPAGADVWTGPEDAE